MDYSSRKAELTEFGLRIADFGLRIVRPARRDSPISDCGMRISCFDHAHLDSAQCRQHRGCGMESRFDYDYEHDQRYCFLAY